MFSFSPSGNSNPKLRFQTLEVENITDKTASEEVGS
jgi:hypothetical protein